MTGLTRFTLGLAVLMTCAACSPGHSWSEQELQLIQSLSIASLDAPPIPDSNRVAANAQAAAFGRKLFHDPALSASGKRSCATCHQPDKFFTDGLARGQGEATLSRNTPTVAGLAWHTWYYWDGRKDSLWSQALAPIEASAEMNSSRRQVATLVGRTPAYRAYYEKLFGEYPEILLQSGRLEHASPVGDEQRKNNWYRVPAGQRDLINNVFANTGKALGAYVRTLEYAASDFDRYVAQLERGNYRKANKILGARSREGLRLFIDDTKTQCLRCHNGPLFTNFEFHNTGSGNFDGDSLDFGRLLGLPSVLMDEFNCLGPYSDAAADGCVHLKFMNRQPDESLKGAYKTPSLRDVSQTAPYFHDGRYASLSEVLLHYNDIANTKKVNTMSELNPIGLNEAQLLALESFLHSLTSAQN